MRSTISSRLVPSLLGPICAAATLMWRAMDLSFREFIRHPRAAAQVREHLDQHGRGTARRWSPRAGSRCGAACRPSAGPDAQLEAEPIHRDHLRRLRGAARPSTRGIQDERVGVVAVHVLDDLRRPRRPADRAGPPRSPRSSASPSRRIRRRSRRRRRRAARTRNPRSPPSAPRWDGARGRPSRAAGRAPPRGARAPRP